MQTENILLSIGWGSLHVSTNRTCLHIQLILFSIWNSLSEFFWALEYQKHSWAAEVTWLSTVTWSIHGKATQASTLNSGPCFTPMGCMILGKSLPLFKPQFPHLKNEAFRPDGHSFQLWDAMSIEAGANTPPKSLQVPAPNPLPSTEGFVETFQDSSEIKEALEQEL